MQVWGKVVGTLFGFMFGRVTGALLGLVVGHIFDTTYSKDFSEKGGFSRFFSSSSEIQQQAVFFHSLFSALGHIAKADGKVTEQDIKIASALMDQMNLAGDVRSEAQQAFRDGKQRDFALTEMLKEFKEQCHARRDVMQIFLEILIQAACANQRLSTPQYNILLNVAKTLGFKKEEMIFLLHGFEAEQRFRQSSSRAKTSSNKHHSGQGQRKRAYANHGNEPYSASAKLNDAFKILGIASTNDVKRIKKAYRKQMSLHHPDKLVSKGLPEQALLLSKKKTQDIQAAYELLRQSKKF
ncbi:co-chaperone DjlA [Glaciecola sp. MH2013]|uniref:co-chaperone DjlA n=1 Tax=Glaciecola sp. MH2013 TaxID=2785524 RepID=UPI00189F514A|nr:co-chaperone DjlA [Glaciecola sp. MH2013]MBF7075077.1 co-chaperone DjlA [Glaciecola sp. MH2013]